MPKSVLLKDSHCKGCTIVDYDDKLKCVLSAGFDGNVKVWSLIENDVVINYSLGTSVKSVVIEDERMFSNVGNNLIEMRSIVTKADKPSVLTTFAGNINDMQLNKSKSKLISCSDDWIIKLLNLTAAGNYKEISFTGHKGPVFGVSMSCDDELLASCSCDGNINIWNVSNNRILKSLNFFEKCKDISNIKNRCRLKFHPNQSKILAILLGKEIILIDCDSYETLRKLSCEESELLIEFAFSPNGNMIVASARGGWIYFWDISKKTALLKWRSDRQADISSIIWPSMSSVNGTEKIIFSDKDGYWEILEIKDEEFVQHSDDFDNASLSMEDLNELFDVDDDDELNFPKPASKADITQLTSDTSSTIVVKENKTDNLSEVSATLNENDTDLDVDYDDAGEDNEISLADLKAEFESPSKKQPIPQPVTLTTTKIIREKRQSHPPVRSTRCPRNENKQILMWNPIAAIKNHYDEENYHNCFLEIDFQDREVHRNLVYRHDTIEYDLGDVNRYALVLVSKQIGSSRQDKDDDDNDDDDEDDEDEIHEPAVIHVRSLNGSWKEWDITLPSNKEKVIGCCLVGEDYAVILSDRYLRYFMLGIGGMQVHIENIYGSPVTIVGSSSYATNTDDVITGNYVIVVVDDGVKLIWRLELLRPTRNGTRWMNRGTLEGVVVTSDWHTLPLSVSSTLKWIGFSDSGAVYTVDSKQIVRRLHMEIDHTNHRFSIPRWTPVLNLKMAMNKECRSIDRYFPIGFIDRNSESTSAIVVHCRDSRYPTVVPWQHLSMVNLQLPLCGPPKSELTQLENSFILNQMTPDWSFNSSALELMEKQLLLKLFANAVNQDQDSRAYSIGKLMPDSQVIQLAIRFAARNNKRGLAERMGELAFQKDEESRLITEKANMKYSNEENDDSTIEKENQEDTEVQVENNEDVNNFWTDILTEKTSNTTDPITDKNESIHPFKVVAAQQSVSRKGLAVIDEMGKNIPHKKSPKKQMNPFGNFVPSPCQQKFKIKSKRKSTLPPGECPLTKAMKK